MYKEINSLYQRAKNRDMKAKEELLTKLTPLVISSIRRFYNKKNDYEDLVQEGYEVILKCIEDYDSERGVHLLGYIKTMLKYHYLNKHREKATLSLNEPLEDGEMLDLLIGEEKDPLDTLIEREEHISLLKSLNTLTPRQKRVIVEFYVNNIPIGEIAKKMGVSYRTVVNIKVNALRKLNKAIVKQ